MYEIEISEQVGELLWGLRKGRTHKYIRRVPKPGGGYRYYYKTSGVTRSVKDDLTEGAKFRLTHEGQPGHFEVVGRSGDTVTLQHDESGGTMRVSAGELADLLKREHASVVQAQRERTAKRLAQARKTGTPKQIARLEAEAKRFGVKAEAPGNSKAWRPIAEPRARKLKAWVRKHGVSTVVDDFSPLKPDAEKMPLMRRLVEVWADTPPGKRQFDDFVSAVRQSVPRSGEHDRVEAAMRLDAAHDTLHHLADHAESHGARDEFVENLRAAAADSRAFASSFLEDARRAAKHNSTPGNRVAEDLRRRFVVTQIGEAITIAPRNEGPRAAPLGDINTRTGALRWYEPRNQRQRESVQRTIEQHFGKPLTRKQRREYQGWLENLSRDPSLGGEGSPRQRAAKKIAELADRALAGGAENDFWAGAKKYADEVLSTP